MKLIRNLNEVLIAIVLVILTVLTISAINTWSFTQYVAYSFFISWGVLGLYYIVTTRNYYSFLLLGLTLTGLGAYLSLLDTDATNTQAALLLGRLSLTVFTALLAYRLFKNKEELGKQATIYLVLMGLLVFQIMIQNLKEVDALSVGGFLNYFTVGIIANILLNGHLSKILNKAERAGLVLIAISCLYSISIMFIANFS